MDRIVVFQREVPAGGINKLLNIPYYNMEDALQKYFDDDNEMHLVVEYDNNFKIDNDTDHFNKQWCYTDINKAIGRAIGFSDTTITVKLFENSEFLKSLNLSDEELVKKYKIAIGCLRVSNKQYLDYYGYKENKILVYKIARLQLKEIKDDE